MKSTVVGLHRRAINSESAKQYERAHQQMPQTVIEALRKVGIQRWLIFRDHCNLFHLIECDDYSNAMQQFQADPTGQHWQTEMAHLLEPAATDANGISLPIPCIWSFYP